MAYINVNITGGKYKGMSGYVTEWNSYGMTDEIRRCSIWRHYVKIDGLERPVPIADYHVTRIDGFPNLDKEKKEQ